MPRSVLVSAYALTFGLVLGLPLLGAASAGRDLDQHFRFPPPVQIPQAYLRFSWFAAAAVLGAIAIVAMPWVRRRPADGAARAADQGSGEKRAFPRWGMLAAGWTLGWWTLAWTRWDGFEPLQRYTFFPLWLGFIVTVNALTQWRAGACLLRRHPWRWAALFPASAVCWWTFEWLNRFVQNWHYLGAEGFTATAYAVHATLCFSTVLPAVAAVAECVSASRRWRGLAGGPRWRWAATRAGAAGLMIGGAAALFATGVAPAACYPALWLAPLALFAGVSTILGQQGLAHELARGDWSRAGAWMSAALVCGFFWEMWNWQSMPKWIYTVPGVERWHVFEMPLLGYAGYLPFGLECLLAVEAAIGRVRWPDR